jgi:hypothetical protein
MPDQLTPEHDAHHQAGPVPADAAGSVGLEPRRPRSPHRPGSGRWQAPAVVVLFAAAGAGLGVLWERLWSPTRGVVVRRQWFVVDDQLRYDLDGLRNQFSGTALFTTLVLGAGVVLGLVCALFLARHELRTLASVALGSALGSVLMWQVGTRLGPPDPDALARDLPRGTVLPDDLELGSLGALVALPLGALLALAVVFFLLPPRRPPET